MSDGCFHIIDPQCVQLPPNASASRDVATPVQCMGRAIFPSLSLPPKTRKFIEIPISGFWSLSHALRRRFIAAKSERAETVCVRGWTTKRGGRVFSSVAPVDRKGVNFSALRLLTRLRSRRRRCRCRRCARLLSFRDGLGRYLGLATVFRFGTRSNLLSVWMILYQRALALTNKRQLRMFAVPIDAHQVAEMHLLRSQQICQRIHDVPLYGPLQVARTIPLVRAFFQQEIAPGTRDAEQELSLRRFQHALLHLAKLDVEHFFQLFASQRMKNNHLVQPVHELRRELPPRRFHRGTLDLLIQASVWLVSRLDESHSAVHQFRDFPATQVRGKKNNRLRQIDSAVVAECQRRLVQDSEQ